MNKYRHLTWIWLINNIISTVLFVLIILIFSSFNQGFENMKENPYFILILFYLPFVIGFYSLAIYIALLLQIYKLKTKKKLLKTYYIFFPIYTLVLSLLYYLFDIFRYEFLIISPVVLVGYLITTKLFSFIELTELDQ
jgi:hypothetical protein